MDLKKVFKQIFICFISMVLFSAVLSGCSDAKIEKEDTGVQTETSIIDGEPVAVKESDDALTDEINQVQIENTYVSKSKDFTSYSFLCPDGWELFETDSGSRVVLKNIDSSLNKTESIFIFVDNLQNNGEIRTDTEILSAYAGMLEDEPTAEWLEEEVIKIDDDIVKLSGYKYESKLFGKDSGNENLKFVCVDYFTFLRNADYLYSIKYIGSNVDATEAGKTFKDFLSTFSFKGEAEGFKEKGKNSSVNILILGDDSGLGRPGGRVNGRTDIIIILHLNLDTCKGTAVTIPRDTWVNIPGRGEGKITEAHAAGGNELTVQTIEEFSGLDIDNYIITDFDGFIPLIDFLGGVTIEVGENLSDDFSGCYLAKGVHHLNGEQALALCRNRHRQGDGTTQPGAFAREREAAKVIVALLEQKSTFERIVSLPLFINYLLRYTWTDLNFIDIFRLLPVLGKINSSDIDITTIPSWPQTFGNASAVAYDKESTAELFEEIKNQ
ncbi:MAG: LytR family transcriptional regulator [Actinobacteria bacterium]|nr:LytR family transcriptional regulator [Actinomycetota bacterium]